MLVVGVGMSEPVSALLRRAMSESSSGVELASYATAGTRDLYGWSVGGELVCVAGISDERPTAELLHLATEPHLERRGHASALIRAAVDELALRELTVETDDDAVGFYRRIGFEVRAVDSSWPGSRYRCRLIR